MDITDINPIAVIGGVIGLIVGLVILKGMSGMSIVGEEIPLALIWKVLIPIACGAGGFFVVQGISSR